jgi:branched-chain amino acid transport system ATP-binding protein
MPLTVDDIEVGYGKKVVVRGVSLHVGQSEVVTLVGPNGSGKSTLLHGIFGALPVRRGKVVWNGSDMTSARPAVKVRAGIAHGLQGAQIYRGLTVAENLLLGAFAISDRQAVEANIAKSYALFPILYERRDNLAGALSGGERQMLAIGAILVSGPRLILLDEPSGGLAPMVLEKVFQAVRLIVDELGASVLLVEQNLKEAFRIADRAYVMAHGQIVAEGPPSELAAGDRLRQAYFGEA